MQEIVRSKTPARWGSGRKRTPSSRSTTSWSVGASCRRVRRELVRHRRGHFVRVAAVFCLAAVVVGCGRGNGAPAGAAANAVVVYCSADKEFADQVFKAYEARTGRQVLPLYDTEETKTAGR